MSIDIRHETAADVLEIGALTIAAFRNAPHTGHIEQSIVNALREAGTLAISLVADTKGTLVGHVAVSPVSISDGTSATLGTTGVSASGPIPNLLFPTSRLNTSKRSRSTLPGRMAPSRTTRLLQYASTAAKRPESARIGPLQPNDLSEVSCVHGFVIRRENC